MKVNDLLVWFKFLHFSQLQDHKMIKSYIHIYKLKHRAEQNKI